MWEGGRYTVIWYKILPFINSELLIVSIYHKYLRKIIPILEMVAGEAQLRSCVSKRKLTLGPNWILSPDGMVRSRLSSSTEFRDSIHSGSMSPSQIIQDWISVRNIQKITDGIKKISCSG